MNTNKRRVVGISAIIFMALFVPLSAVAAVHGNQFAGRDKPPKMGSYEIENALQQSNGVNAGKETVLMDGERTKFLLGYLNSSRFRVENVVDSQNEEEVTRITRKNALMQEYRTYVEELDNQEMTVAEYEAHYKHLMSMYHELLLLRPEETKNEILVNYVSRLLSKLEDEIVCCEHGNESYVKDPNIDVAMIREGVADLTSLKQMILSETKTYEDLKTEYLLCLEKAKKAIPDDYAHMLRCGLFSENL